MKTKLVLTIAAAICCIYLNCRAQNEQPGYLSNGFTDKTEAENKYVDGFKEGKWIEYCDEGLNPTKKENAAYYRLIVYNKGKFSGIVRDYFMDGAIYRESMYINGEENGIFKGYRKNGTLYQCTSFLHGNLNGVSYNFEFGWINYYRNDSVISSRSLIQSINNYIASDKMDSAKFLIDNYKNINEKDKTGYTPLLTAIAWKYIKDDNADHIEIIDFLIAHNADVNIADDKGNTPLDYAKQNKDGALIEVLKTHGAKRGNKFHDGNGGGDGSGWLAVIGTFAQVASVYNYSATSNSGNTTVTNALNQNITNLNNQYSAVHPSAQNNNSSQNYTYTGGNNKATGYSNNGSSGYAFSSNQTSNAGAQGSSGSSGILNGSNSGSGSSALQTKYATECGQGCNLVQATLTKTTHCGNSDYNYSLYNNSTSTLDVFLYVVKNDGNWQGVGEFDNIAPGATVDATWECDVTNKYITYYRLAGATDVLFPAGYQLNQWIPNK